MQKIKYLVVIERSKEGYSAQAPDVLGCISFGRTVEELLKNMTEALSLHLEGGEIPVPHDLAWHFRCGDSELLPGPDSLTAYVEVEVEDHIVA